MTDHQVLFEASPNPYMVVDRELRYVAVNQAYLQVTGRTREQLLGQRVTDVFPHDPSAPDNDATRRLLASFERVFTTGQADALPLIHYRIDGERDDYWRATHTPLRDGDGVVRHLLQHTVNITDHVDTRDRLQWIFAHAPVAITILQGPSYVIELANERVCEIWGRPRGLLLGRRLFDALPEIADQGIRELLDRVRASRRPHQGTDLKVQLRRGPEGELDDVYFDFLYHPLIGRSGEVDSIVVIATDVTEAVQARRRATAAKAELEAVFESERAARAQAERANALKDEFLAIVSHELRTPLSAILGWMQLLRTGVLSDTRRAHALDTIERNARIQAQLIDDLLDVSRIISGKFHLEMEACDVAAFVAAGVETVRPAAESKGVRLELSVDDSVQVRGDAHRLQQVVWNLLANAVKFTPAGGAVRLAVRPARNQVEIEVADDGIGIAPEFLPHVFERFRQAEGGTTRRIGGLGLGLSIVHHVVLAHGGSVDAHSDGAGRGSTFRVRLPVLGAARARDEDHQQLAALSAPAIDGLRVLIVDDEQDTREYLRTLLAACRAEVDVAGSVAEALAAFRRRPPDVLLSDIGMPGEDGYQLIQRIRALADADGGRTPAIALTAYARSEDRTRAMRAGFQNHVTKPIQAEELVAAVASLAPRR